MATLQKIWWSLNWARGLLGPLSWWLILVKLGPMILFGGGAYLTLSDFFVGDYKTSKKKVWLKAALNPKYNLPLKYCISIVIAKKKSHPTFGLKNITAVDLPLNSEQEGTHFWTLILLVHLYLYNFVIKSDI